MFTIRFRGFISILLSLAFLLVVLTGLVLWLSHAPETFGLGKGVWKHGHIFLSLLMLLAGILHFWLNWSVYWRYFRSTSAGRAWRVQELALALAITALVVCMASLGGQGDMGRLFGMALREVAANSDQPVDRLVATLKEEGIAVHDPGDSILEIAQHNGTAPDAVLGALRRALPDAMRPLRGPH
jgi:hypothetical protein